MATERSTAAVIDAYASEPHYRDHIAPIFDALPSDIRGDWVRHGAGPVIVASFKDLLAVGRRPVIFVEHGAGQTYGQGHPSYPGGRNRETVALFICPSERVARANRDTYPQTPAIVVGCPKLDAYLPLEQPMTGVVGFAFHWNAHVCPESRSALPHYRGVLAEIAQRYHVLGHAHPRIAEAAAKVYADAGIEVVDADTLFKTAHVLVVDNSSIGWEFVALDRPVVWLNAPWYRRDAHHGLRFWEFADSGVIVNEPDDLAAGIAVALADEPEQATRRREVARELYGYLDAHSADRAAAAIVSTFGG